MIENVLKNENLQQAYQRIFVNKGASGVDGKSVNDLLSDLQKHQKVYIQSIREGNYQSAPILGIEIPKSNGKTRLLGVPTVVDRVFQQAIQQVLQPIFEQDFQTHSYGFRPKRKPTKPCINPLSAIAYNIKKYLKFIEKQNKSGAASLRFVLCRLKAYIQAIFSPNNQF